MNLDQPVHHRVHLFDMFQKETSWEIVKRIFYRPDALPPNHYCQLSVTVLKEHKALTITHYRLESKFCTLHVTTLLQYALCAQGGEHARRRRAASQPRRAARKCS